MYSDSKVKYAILVEILLVTAMLYWPGLSGYFTFDDFPNIVDNKGVQLPQADVPSLVRAALSSPSSEISRPLASLSFAANYLATGLNPFWMKLTNLIIHLLNGFLVFLLSKVLLRAASLNFSNQLAPATSTDIGHHLTPRRSLSRTDITALLISASWLLLPINLTAVLYVVQRMESMANLFVLLGLFGYVTGRQRMLTPTLHTLAPHLSDIESSRTEKRFKSSNGFGLCLTSLTLPTAIGILAKETAAMLPLYALMVELILFHFNTAHQSPATTEDLHNSDHADQESIRKAKDKRIVTLFLLVLVLPMAVGLAWLIPKSLNPQSWITRDFTLSTRLLSEARIVTDYVVWTLIPTPHGLSFYHDDFIVSSGLLTPWTTLAGIIALAGFGALAFCIRASQPLAALGIALFLSCHLLTGTIIPLELIYEHRNYFASFGLLLAVIPLLTAPVTSIEKQNTATEAARRDNFISSLINNTAHTPKGGLPFGFARYTLLTGLLISWASLTALTAYSWGNPIRLAEELARRAPQSPRAQYELGRSYIIATEYDPNSKFTHLVYAPLERAAALPNASILPEQALIFMNARMHLPLKDMWWNSLIAKLKARPPTVQDESSLVSLTDCIRSHECELPEGRMNAAFEAALFHPNPTARLLANYGDYAWNVLGDQSLGLRMTEASVAREPSEPAYHITLIRMLVVLGKYGEAEKQITELNKLNYGGRLNTSIAQLRGLPGLREKQGSSEIE